MKKKTIQFSEWFYLFAFPLWIWLYNVLNLWNVDSFPGVMFSISLLICSFGVIAIIRYGLIIEIKD